jgi:hypothetical protein
MATMVNGSPAAIRRAVRGSVSVNRVISAGTAQTGDFTMGPEFSAIKGLKGVATTIASTSAAESRKVEKHVLTEMGLKFAARVSSSEIYEAGVKIASVK